MLTPLIFTAFLIAPDPKAGEVVQAVSADRCKGYVETLAAFGTRHSLSDTGSETRGTGAARRWLKSTMESFTGASGLTVAFEEFDVPKMARLPEGAHLVNVVGTLPGQMPEAAKRIVYVMGHYDSMNSDRVDGKADAPGANDDASGTAVVLECCRVLAGRKLDATVVFLCTAAEEQGLVGAKYHADSLAAKGAHDFVFALSNDIVGDPSVKYVVPEASGPDATTFVRLFSEGIPKNAPADVLAKIRTEGAESDSTSRQLARYVAYVADREGLAFKPKLVFRQDRFLRGGDHSAFNDAGFPGVRFTVPAEDYTRQHVHVTEKDGKPYGDLPEFVSGEYVANVARLNAASIVHLANAPSPPKNASLLTAQLDQGTTVRWDAPPEPDVVGYEIVVRETTAFDWSVLEYVEHNAGSQASPLTKRLELSKDNYFFGVRSVDRDGYRSPVAFCWAARQ